VTSNGEGSGSNLGRKVDNSDQGVSWFSLVPPSKCRDGISKQAMTLPSISAHSVLGRDALQSGRISPTFRRNVLPPTSGSNSKPSSNQQECISLQTVINVLEEHSVYIVAYLLKARTVEPKKYSLLVNDSEAMFVSR
jgi:hypothetical protein